jgi:NADH-quinone oxidoreductase subunit K
MPIEFTLALSASIFLIGVLGVIIRRDPLVLFISIEMMFNAANLGFVGLSDYFHMLDGQVLVFLVLAVAAAEVAVGLAIIIAIFRNEEDVDVDRISLLKG